MHTLEKFSFERVSANMEGAAQQADVPQADVPQAEAGVSELEGAEETATPLKKTLGFVCTTCGVTFAKKYNRDRHIVLRHNNIVRVYDCTFCGAVFDNMTKLRDHRDAHAPSTGFELNQSAFRKKCAIYRKTYGEKVLTLENAFALDTEEMLKLLEFEVAVRKSIKIGLIYHVEFTKYAPQFGGGDGEQLDDVDFAEQEEQDTVAAAAAAATPPPPPQTRWRQVHDETVTIEALPEDGEQEQGNEEREGEETNDNDDNEGWEQLEEGWELEDTQPEIENPVEEDMSNLENEISQALNVGEETYEICLRAPSESATAASNLLNIVRNAQRHMQTRADDFVENGSGWRLNAVLRADIEMGNCASLNGACSLLSIRRLNSFKSARVSKDKKNCFLHAIAHHFVKSEDKMKLEKFIKKFLFVKVPCPVRVKDVAKFEEQNKHLRLKINVLYAEEESIYPLVSSKRKNAKHCITLLLYKTEVEGKAVNHYAYVQDVNTLLKKRYKGKKCSYENAVTCVNCFSKFQNSNGCNGQKKLEQHFEHCSKNQPQIVKVPTQGDVVEFKKHVNKFPSYFIGFFDFESCHIKQQFECVKCKKVAEDDVSECTHQTLVKAVQEPITCSYLILDRNETIVFKNTFTGEKCVQQFLSELITIESDLLAVLNRNEPINMGLDDEKTFTEAEVCHICDLLLLHDKVRDHCHITGDFLGAAHSLCNLARAERKKIPLFCHNLTGYDGHFLMQHLGGLEGLKTLTALPYNTEKFRTIEINSFQLKDSLSFLNASLNELMNDLLKNKQHRFPVIDQLELYRPNETEKKKLLLRKGVYPYEYVTSIQKLQKTRRIPSKKHFFSSLTNSNISDDDYEHSKKVFAAFGCSNMVCYTELYCAMDVGILAEVVLQFRKLILQEFQLDCCHYISTPQLAFDCMLRQTNVKIELLADVDQIMFIEQNIRGGVSYINQRHCKEELTSHGETQLKFIDGTYFANLTK